MKIFVLISLSLIIGIVLKSHFTVSGAPPYGEAENEVPNTDPYAWLKDWKRPEGPPRVGLQVGHWKNDELPGELSKLIGNTGSSGGGKSEWEVNFVIAEKTAELLKEKGIQVDILPATVPVKYWADVFVSVHADGSLDRSVSGFKVAGPWRDWSGNSAKLVTNIDESYANATGLPKDYNISRNMKGYYAFSFWRYEHAVHPMTTSAILETGFLTNANDRKIIVSQPEVSAIGLANGVIKYLTNQNLL
jgi:hypothetical protein